MNLFGEEHGQAAHHCTNLAGDRSLGEWAEKQFCRVAAASGKTFTPHQIGRPGGAACAYYAQNNGIHPLLLPDVTVWSAPGEHHEIKTKTPTRRGYFGLEVYRLEALLKFATETQQEVRYTILNWENVGKFAEQTFASDWLTISVAKLDLLARLKGGAAGTLHLMAGRATAAEHANPLLGDGLVGSPFRRMGTNQPREETT